MAKVRIGFELWIGNGCYDQVGPGGDWNNDKIVSHAALSIEHFKEDIIHALAKGQSVDIKFINERDPDEG